jgi:hypothetical protein
MVKWLCDPAWTRTQYPPDYNRDALPLLSKCWIFKMK